MTFDDYCRPILGLMFVALTIAVVRTPAQSAFEEPPAGRSTAPALLARAIDPVFPAVPTEHTPVTLKDAAAPKARPNAKKLWVLSGVVMTAASLLDFGASVGPDT